MKAKKTRRRGEGEPRRNPRVPGSPHLPLIALLIGLLTFALYLPTLKSGFVYDAEAQVLVDGYIHERANFFEVISLRVLSRDVLDFNRPVQLLSLMVDSLCWGRNPFGYHLTSNLVHALNAALLFLLILRLAEAGGIGRSGLFPWIAAAGALLFAWHPVNVEAVAEVSCREDLLATFFLLAGLLLADAFAQAGGRKAVGLAIGCVAALFLACGAKETGLAGPFLLGLYGVLYRRKQPARRWVILIAASFAATMGFIAARFYFQPPVSQIFLTSPGYIGGSLAKVFEIQPRVWVFLLKSIFWPFGLSADYMPADVAWLTLPAALVVLAVFLFLQFLLGWKCRTALFGAAVFWLGLAPVSNFLPIYRPLADRFLYLPMAGLALALAGFLLLASRRREILPWLLAGFVLLLIPLATLTWQRQTVFANPLNLWLDTLAKSPFSDTAADNLGYALLTKGDYEKSLTAFQRALQLTNGNKVDALAGAALAWEKSGRPEQAEEALRQAVARNPLYAEPQKLVKALLATPEHAAILEKITERMRKK